MNLLKDIKLLFNRPEDSLKPQSYSEKRFMALIEEVGNRLMPQGKKFNLRDGRYEYYQQLVRYFLNDSQYKGDLSKGLFIHGTKGTGKTLSIQIFRNLFYIRAITTKKSFWLSPCDKIVLEYETRGAEIFEKFDKNNWCYEDLGTEQRPAMHYGTPRNVMREILASSYRNWMDNGQLTFITSNFNMELIAKEYDIRIEDRFKEQFNNIILTGESLR